MHFTALLAVLVLATIVLATPMTTAGKKPTTFADNPSAYMKGFKNPTVQSSIGGQAICISGIVDVTASANNYHISYQEPASQIAVTELVVEFTQINSTLSKRAIGSKSRTSGTYGIYSQLCFPNGTINATTIQFLIHGVAFDRSYWSVAPNYSYVDFAAEQGYTTFFYDRLGTGLSDHPDPIQVVQAELQVVIAHELIQLLRAGAVASHSFKNVVGVGHSFGSLQTIGVTSQYHKDLDAAVLTGVSTSSAELGLFLASLDLTIASQNQPLRFPDLPNGYLVSNSIESNQFAFFRAPNFDPALLNIAEVTKQTLTVGEFLTLGFIAAGSPDFTGALDVVNGENDLCFCQGDCLLPYNQAVAVKEELYPAVSEGSESYIVAGVGHGLNLHYSAPTAYEHIHNFIRKNGL